MAVERVDQRQHARIADAALVHLQLTQAAVGAQHHGQRRRTPARVTGAASHSRKRIVDGVVCETESFERMVGERGGERGGSLGLQPIERQVEPPQLPVVREKLALVV